jgi:hypothetical protein
VQIDGVDLNNKGQDAKGVHAAKLILGLCDIYFVQFSVTPTVERTCATDTCSSVSLRISFHSRNDVPGGMVNLKFKRPSTGAEFPVMLIRGCTSELADQRKMFQYFTQVMFGWKISGL